MCKSQSAREADLPRSIDARSKGRDGRDAVNENAPRAQGSDIGCGGGVYC